MLGYLRDTAYENLIYFFWKFMIKENKIIIALVGLSSILILVLGILLVNKSTPPVLETSGSAKVAVLGEKTHNWGQIDIKGGNVEKVFQIKNTGESDLEVTNFKTSCMCTETQISISEKKSPIFGMHTRSGWKGVIKPGETADVSVVFDPMFHGPQATGPITRLVSFNTNDADNRTVEFNLTGNVISVDN